MNSTFSKDYKQGKKAETSVLPIISVFFNDDITQIGNSYSSMDFKGSKNIYELKSRNNKYNTYPTTMIAVDKLNENGVYLFSFYDGLYYIEYNKDLFDTFEIKPFQRIRFDRIDVEKPYIYIPIEHLHRIN